MYPMVTFSFIGDVPLRDLYTHMAWISKLKRNWEQVEELLLAG